MFQTKIINDKDQWEAAVAQFSEANFLQSWNWGVFNERMGKQVYRLALVSQDLDSNDGEVEEIKALIQAVREPARRGAYLAVAGGPLADWEDVVLMEQVFATLRQLGQQEKCLFIRFRPQVLENEASLEQAKIIGAVKSPMHLTADLTLQLRLSQSEEELLQQMRKNTRSSVRKSLSMGIKTELSSDPKDMADFCRWQRYLAEKHKFVAFSDRFLTEQFQALVEDDQVCLVKSSYQGKLLSMAFVIFYNGEAVYHYGVSTPDNGHLPGSYACQWAAILEAKRRGCVRYNFWGVAPEEMTNHRFAGVSLFKRGFGGQEIPYLTAHDLPISNRYWLTYAFEYLRKKLRRL
jgi:lipid II:glycine glycyltransferase (peptidoglycan interpeptide bridge formation enzyme)